MQEIECNCGEFIWMNPQGVWRCHGCGLEPEVMSEKEYLARTDSCIEMSPLPDCISFRDEPKQAWEKHLDNHKRKPR